MQLTVLPLIAARMDKMFNLFGALQVTLRDNNTRLQDGDVLVISTKYVSNSQGRILNLNDVKTSREGREISRRFRIKAEVAEAIHRESERIFGGVGGFVITMSSLTSSATSLGTSRSSSLQSPDGSMMAPNAGIDKSNAKKETVILYPVNPFLAAEQIRRKAFLRWLVHIGVILVDSRLMPTRVGTSGVAVSCAGIEPVLDKRAEVDLDGNPLKVTFQATADNLATIANQMMGEGAESKPFAIVRDSGVRITDRAIGPSEMTVPAEQCVYVRGLATHYQHV